MTCKIDLTTPALSGLSDALSDALYRVQDKRDDAQPRSSDKKVLRKATHLLDTLMTTANDLSELMESSDTVRQAMEEPNVEQP